LPTLRRATLFPLLLLAVGSGAWADEGTPLDRYFRGEVAALKGKVVTLRYDFSDAKQVEDWIAGVPFPVDPVAEQGIKWFDEKLEIKGSTGARHKADWTGDLAVTATLVLDGEKDIGGYLTPADGEPDYATFTLNEEYFHKWDGKAGGNHSILKFGKQWREVGSTTDFTGFRYVDQRPPPAPIRAGHRVTMTFSVVAGKFFLTVGEFEIKGADRGNKLKEVHAGLYAIKGRVLVDEVVLTGKLSDAWLQKERVELRTEVPIVEGGPGRLDPATRAVIAGYAEGKSTAADLVKIAGDSSRPPVAREAAVAALCAGPKKAVPAVIDLLYGAEEETRAQGISIVKALLGKDYGFNPKGSEESRSAAIRKLNDDLKAHPEWLAG
jgi:hypothetical protein